MRNGLATTLLIVLCLVAGCGRDPEAAKRKYVESGNRYFENGKYKEALIMYRNALKRDQKYGEAHYRAALTELKLQRPIEAMRSLQRAVELQPDNLDAHNQLANILLAAYLLDPKRPKPVLAELHSMSDKYHQRFPDTYEAARLAGYLALAENNVPEAVKQFEAANRSKPFQPDLVLIYMQALVAAKRPEDAEKLAHDMLNHDPTALGVYDALYVYYARNKRMADAEKVLETKIQKNPKVIDGYMQLARYYYGSQRRDEMMTLLKKVSDDSATFPNGSLDTGNFFVSIREFDLAAQQFRNGIQRAPKNKAEYQRALAETLAKQKKVGEAAEVVADVLRENPKDERAIAMRGALTLLGGSKEHLDSAISDLQSAVRDMPRNPVVRYNLGRAMLAKGDQAQARTQFEESIKLNPTYSPPKLQLAQMLLRAGDYPRTAQLSQEVLAYDPSNAPARLLRGRALIAMGDLTEARRELEQTTAAYPNYSEARLQLAAVDLRDKKFSAAEKAFRDVYQNSEDPRAFIGLVETQIAQNRVPAGLQMLKEEIGKHPDRMEYRIALANVSALTSDYSTAIAEYNKVLEKNPKNSQVWLQLAETYRRSGDAGKAVDGLKKTIELAPNDVRPHLQLAVLYDTAGRKSEARPYYDRVLQLDPNNPVALNNLAYMLAESGRDLDQALTMAQRATQQRPNDGDVADTLGLIYIKKNLADSAIGVYRKLTGEKPDRALYRFHFALALAQKGETAQARQQCEVALKSKPAKEEEAEIRALMAKLG